MAAGGVLKAVLKADTGSFNTSMRGAMGIAAGTAKAITAVGAAAVATAAAVAVLSTKTAMDLQASIVDAGAKANATAVELQQLRRAALDAGRDTEHTATAAAEGLGMLAQAGYDTNQQIAALNPVLGLATAGQVEMAAAAETTSSTLKAFNMDVGEAGRVADVLVKAANSANTNVDQLSNALSKAGGIAGATGQQLEGVVTVIASMQNAGTEAAVAGTAVRTMLARLSEEGGKAEQTLAAIGVASRDSGGGLRQVNDILADMVDQGATANDFVEAFGVEIGPTLLTATSQGSRGLRDLNEALENSGGTAATVAEKQMATLKGQVNQLDGSFTNLKAAIGDAFVPTATEATGELIALTNAATENDAVWKDLRAGVTASVDVAADLVRVVGKLSEIFIVLGGVIGEASRPIEGLINTLQIMWDLLRLIGNTLTFQFDAVSDAATDLGEDIDDQIQLMGGFGDRLKGAKIAGAEFSDGADTMADKMQNVAARARAAGKEIDRLREAADKASRESGPMSLVGGGDQGGVSRPSDEEWEAQRKAAAETEKKTAELNEQLRILDLQLATARATDPIRRRQLELATEVAEIRAKEADAAVKAKEIAIARVAAERDIADELERQAAAQASGVRASMDALQGAAASNDASMARASANADVGGHFAGLADSAGTSMANTDALKSQKQALEATSEMARIRAEFDAARHAAVGATNEGLERQVALMQIAKSESQQIASLERKRAQETQSMVGAVGNLAGNLAAAAGASQDFTTALNGSMSVAEQLVPLLAGTAANPVMGAIGIAGTIFGMVAGMGGSGGGGGGRKRETRDMAKEFARAFADEIEDRQLMGQTTVIDAGGPSSPQRTREMTNGLQRELRRQGYDLDQLRRR